MMWYYGGWGWGGWVVMTLMMVLFWAAVVGVIVVVLRQGSGGPSEPTRGPAREPLRILEERFARGEIDEAEYKQRRDVLQGSA